jgi:hypothetical protein
VTGRIHDREVDHGEEAKEGEKSEEEIEEDEKGRPAAEKEERREGVREEA